MSDEYWIISVPGKATPRQSYDEVCEATSRDQLSVNYFFNIPDLKVQLMYESSSKFFFIYHRLVHSIRSFHFRMISLDLIIISKGINSSHVIDLTINYFRVTRKLTQYFFHDVLEDDRNRLAENLTIGSNSGRHFFQCLFFLIK